MKLLMTIAVLFSDDISMPIKIKQAAIEANVEDLNIGNVLNQECLSAIKKVQIRNERQIKRNRKILDGEK